MSSLQEKLLAVLAVLLASWGFAGLVSFLINSTFSLTGQIALVVNMASLGFTFLSAVMVYFVARPTRNQITTNQDVIDI